MRILLWLKKNFGEDIEVEYERFGEVWEEKCS